MFLAVLWTCPIRISARKLSWLVASVSFLAPSNLVHALFHMLYNTLFTGHPTNRYCIIRDTGRVDKWANGLKLSSVSDVAHGNFSVETPPSQDLPIQSDVYVEKKHASGQGDLPGKYTDEAS